MAIAVNYQPESWFLQVTLTGSVDDTQVWLATYREILQYCEHLQLPAILILDQLQWYPLTTMEAFGLGEEMAQERHRVVAMVLLLDNPTVLSTLQFMGTVASNRGGQIEMFTTVAAAQAWLRSRLGL